MEPGVYIRSVTDYSQPLLDQAVEDCLAALPVTQRLGPGSHVLLKPNLLAKHPPESAVTTHPAVVGAVIRALKRRGVPAQSICCADSMGGLYNPALAQAAYRVSGLEQACATEGVTCYTQCQWDARPVPNGVVAQEFNLLRPVLEADFIIDLPKLKSHVMTGCTAAVKNLFGCVPGLQKAEWHTRFPDRERFGEMLIDLLQTVRPDLAILDGILALEGDGPSGGEPRRVGLLLAAQDLPLLDLAACGLMGLEPMKVPYLQAAYRRGLCPAAFDPALLRGDTAAYGPIPGWKLPSTYQNGSLGSTDFADHRRFGRLLRWAERWGAPHPVVRKSACIGCGKCAEICPRHTIRLSGQGKGRKAHVVQAACIRCFCCHEMCPVKAIDLKKLPIFKL